MKKIIKTLLALSAVSVLTACGGAQKEAYRGIRIDFNTMKGYLTELDYDWNDIYIGRNTSGEATYVTDQLNEGVSRYTYDQHVTYEFDYDKQIYHVRVVCKSTEDYYKTSESFVSKYDYDYYYVLDKKEGLYEYASKSDDDGDPVKTKNLVLSVEDARSEAISNDTNINYIFQKEGFNCINDFMDIEGFHNYHTVNFFGDIYYSSDSDSILSSYSIVDEEYYVDFYNNNFEAKVVGEKEVKSDSVGSFSYKGVKTLAFKYENKFFKEGCYITEHNGTYKDSTLGDVKATFTSLDKCVDYGPKTINLPDLTQY